MKIRTQLGLWYSAILLNALLLIGGWTYYEIAVEHPTVTKVLAAEGHTALGELGEILLYGGLPSMVIALVGGWFLMRRALGPVTSLTRVVETIRAENLRQQIPRTGNGDELDRLAEVFNSMTTRLDTSFTQIKEFTLNASHELKTPLTIMRGEIETRLRETAPTSPDRDFFASQLDEIARLSKIVDALTLLAKADAGQVAMRSELIRLDELVRENFIDAQLLAQREQIQVELPRCDEAMVCGDRHRLRQLLLNLTDNAIKYNRPQGSIIIRLDCANGHAELSIANTGPGISAEKLSRVFDRFYRGDASHNSAVEGCGLGLSIVQSIAKAHHGEVTIESTPMEWTTVTIKLPMVRTLQRSESKFPPPKVPALVSQTLS
jgi:signal transduction histidine kinase